MKDIFPKFIIEDDNLILSKVTFHKDIATDPNKVKGGGWFDYSEDTNTFIFYGKSEDFGAASLEDIKSCVENKNVYSNKYLINSLVGKYNFAYRDDSGLVILN